MDRLSHIIGDGYTRDDGYIAPVRGLHGAQRFTWRPMLAMVRQQYLLEIGRAEASADGAKITRIGQEALLTHVVDLELANQDGVAIPIMAAGEKQPGAEEALLKAEPNLLIRLQNVVLGLSPPDEVPVELEPVRPGGLIVDEAELTRRATEGRDRPSTVVGEEIERELADQGN